MWQRQPTRSLSHWKAMSQFLDNEITVHNGANQMKPKRPEEKKTSDSADTKAKSTPYSAAAMHAGSRAAKGGSRPVTPPVGSGAAGGGK